MEKILTIAVPAYNAARYLDKCLSSFLIQGKEMLDVIVVNDGSTDETGRIADEYANAYPDVFRVIHKENGGHGSGINCAAAVARGKYFRIVDADDWVISDNLEELIQELKTMDSDVVLTHFHTVDMITGERIPFRNEGAAYHRTYSPMELIHSMKQAARWFCIHAITYRTAFYQALDLKLTEKIFYEDTEYAVLPFKACSSICLLDLYLYEYQVGNASQSVSIVNYAKRNEHMERVLRRLLGQYQTLDHENSAAELFLRIKIQLLLGTYEKIMLLYLQEKAKGRSRVKSIRREIKTLAPVLLRGTQLRYSVLLLCSFLKISPEWAEEKYRKYRSKRVKPEADYD